MPNAVIEFEHLINESEADSQYINLTDSNGKRHGRNIAPRDTLLRVLDGEGRTFRMRRHGPNQLTGCSAWFHANGVNARTKISVTFDPIEHVLRLATLRANPTVQPERLGAVSFAHAGKQYEITCTRGGAGVRVIALVDGQAVREFVL